ncbi:MAG: hypothetical protein K6G18_13845 [Treponema sp.]|nr:hypothetical protein [Treponema sp.]
MKGKEVSITKAENSRDYERVLFCMKAMGRTAAATFVRYMHVENARKGSRIVCTDGKRLHVANLSIRIPAGNYQPKATGSGICFGQPVETAFPAWRNVVPEDAAFKGTMELGWPETGTRSEREEKFSRMYCALQSDSGVSVNMGFLKDLPSAKWKVFARGGQKKLLMLENSEEKEQFAVFVPLAA